MRRPLLLHRAHRGRRNQQGLLHLVGDADQSLKKKKKKKLCLGAGIRVDASRPGPGVCFHARSRISITPTWVSPSVACWRMNVRMYKPKRILPLSRHVLACDGACLAPRLAWLGTARRSRETVKPWDVGEVPQCLWEAPGRQAGSNGVGARILYLGPRVILEAGKVTRSPYEVVRNVLVKNTQPSPPP